MSDRIFLALHLLLDEMEEAGFTRHERNNFRIRKAAERLLVRGRLYYADDATEIEHGVAGPFNDDERCEAAKGKS